MLKWRAEAEDGRSLVIRCESIVDARVTAMRALATVSVRVSPAEGTVEPELELQWRRSPGPPRVRRLEIRKQVDGIWGPWVDERTFSYRSAP